MSESAFGGGRLLLDSSGWTRARHPDVEPEWEEAVRAGQIVICPPFMIEALFSARNRQEYEEWEEMLRGGFDHASVDAGTWAYALRAQRQLAAVAPSFHRRPPIDLLIAAAAHQHGLGVLHYDADYDVIAEHTELEFESRWIAPRGKL